ncbi:uncharacterized protein LOC115012483 [Cottoperca gobio]|uniref:Uncharacterized protein LOC115012483 n=1 Tax=Cottoperca gobio TaxID=56716 RepID=A0A6J2Q8F9_COTGO|nr:uncharacterized protein LOC115012483 [Cottoperca gobio]
MEVSPQDPSLMAMDLSKGYSVTPLSRGHTDALDLAKKPEWYHRRLPSCSPEIGSPYRSRASSSYNSDPGAHCGDVEPGSEALSNYMNSTRAPGLYPNGGNLWHPGFYGADQRGGAVPESSSGGEESDSDSDVIFLVSSAKEPLSCSSFIQDSVRHILEPPFPAASSLDEARGCCRPPPPLSSPGPDSSYSDSSDTSVDIPVHHARPVVLLSDLSAVYGNPAESAVDISSDDSDVIEVSVTNEKKKSFSCKKSRNMPPHGEEDEAPPRNVRRSTRIRKSVSEIPQYTCSASPCGASRHRLRRQAKNDAVGIYNESCDSEDVMEHAVRLSSSDAEDSVARPNVSQRASGDSEESNVETDRKAPQTDRKPCRRSVACKRKKPLPLRTTQQIRTKQKLSCTITPEQRERKRTRTTVARRKKKVRPQPPRPCAPFPPREPEIKLKYANVKKIKRAESFCPFVCINKRTCTVVNHQEEEVAARRGRQQNACRSQCGFVPSTSCFQLGRFGSESRAPSTPLCCLCGQTANATNLGDLHGPYYPSGSSLRCESEQKEDEGFHVSRRSVNSSDDAHDCSAVRRLLEDDCHSKLHPKVPLHFEEGWIHEDCGIWSAGVFLVRGKLYGLEEAAQLAQETKCSACQQTGAIMGCFQKGCLRNYHYRCAVQSGCVLNEDNFSVRCPEHTKKAFTNRRHKR